MRSNRRKCTTKKHTTWDSDGILRVVDGFAYLEDIPGKDMGRATCNGPLLPGSGLPVGGKEVEIESLLSGENCMAGRPFLSTGNTKPTAPAVVELPSRPKSRSKPEFKAKRKTQRRHSMSPLLKALHRDRSGRTL